MVVNKSRQEIHGFAVPLHTSHEADALHHAAMHRVAAAAQARPGKAQQQAPPPAPPMSATSTPRCGWHRSGSLATTRLLSPLRRRRCCTAASLGGRPCGKQSGAPRAQGAMSGVSMSWARCLMRRLRRAACWTRRRMRSCFRGHGWAGGPGCDVAAGVWTSYVGRVSRLRCCDCDDVAWLHLS